MKSTFMQKIGLTHNFIYRRKKKNFSVVAFVKYLVKTWSLNDR